MTFVPPINVVLVGHVDHGKSTFIGRLLLDSGNVRADRKTDDLAHLTDQFEEERVGGLTIDTTQIPMMLDERRFVLIDAPGHKEFLKNMLTGAGQAQTAFLIVDVTQGVQMQTEKHARLLKLLGIKRVAALINKMDAVNFSETEFQALSDKMKNLFKQNGLLAVDPIPVSAKEGDNVVNRSSKTPWYKGPTAIDFLRSSTQAVSNLSEGEACFPVQTMHTIKNKVFALGRVERGRIQSGQTLHVFPGDASVKVKAVSRFELPDGPAQTGDSVGLELEPSLKQGRGVVLCDRERKPVRHFSADVFWGGTKPLAIGNQVRVECRTQAATARVIKLRDEIEERTLDNLEEAGIARVDFEMEKDILLEAGGATSPLARIVLSANGAVEGCGIVVQTD